MSGSSRGQKRDPPVLTPDYDSFLSVTLNKEGDEPPSNPPKQLDIFSSFLYNTGPTLTNQMTVDTQLGTATEEMNIDDIFTDMDPRPSYRDEELDFFSF